MARNSESPHTSVKTNLASVAGPDIGASTGADNRVAAANCARAGLNIFNDSTAIMYILYSNGGTDYATTTNYSHQIAPGTSFFVPKDEWNGEIRAFWATANGAARITEVL